MQAMCWRQSRVGSEFTPHLIVEKTWNEGKRQYIRLKTRLINQRNETVLEGFHVYQMVPKVSET